MGLAVMVFEGSVWQKKVVKQGVGSFLRTVSGYWKPVAFSDDSVNHKIARLCGIAYSVPWHHCFKGNPHDPWTGKVKWFRPRWPVSVVLTVDLGRLSSAQMPHPVLTLPRLTSFVLYLSAPFRVYPYKCHASLSKVIRWYLYIYCNKNRI